MVLTTTNVAKKVSATAKDDKYTYDVEYSVNNNGKTLEGLQVTANTINNVYAATVTLCIDTKDLSIVAKDGVDTVAVINMYEAIFAEINDALIV